MAKKALEENVQTNEQKMIEELQILVEDLKLKIKYLEDEILNTKVIEKIVEIPIDRIIENTVEVEKIIETFIDNTPSKFNDGDKVYVPDLYQRMDFEIITRQGFGENQPLYKLYNHYREIELNFVPENKIFKF